MKLKSLTVLPIDTSAPAKGTRTLLDESERLREGFGSTFYPALFSGPHKPLVAGSNPAAATIASRIG